MVLSAVASTQSGDSSISVSTATSAESSASSAGLHLKSDSIPKDRKDGSTSRLDGDASAERRRGVVYTHPIDIQSGVLAGKRMRFALEMAQQPIHGRRNTEKDRRPLAHCPILRLGLRQVNGNEEEDLDLGPLEPGHFVCSAELIDAPTHDYEDGTDRDSSLRSISATSITTTASTSKSEDRKIHDNNISVGATPGRGDSPTAADRNSSRTEGDGGVAEESGSKTHGSFANKVDRGWESWTSRLKHTLPHSASSASISSSSTVTPKSQQRVSTPQVVGTPDELGKSRSPSPPPSRPGLQRTAANRSSASSIEMGTSSKTSAKKLRQVETRNLYGSLHVPAVRVVAPEGDMGLWFLFTDLTVRQEGKFALQFSVFDITAADKTTKMKAPILVQAQSQDFKVYSPRNFPGLPKPTELAEHFGRQGFRLNTRKNERQAKTPPPPNAASAPASASSSSRVPHRAQGASSSSPASASLFRSGGSAGAPPGRTLHQGSASSMSSGGSRDASWPPPRPEAQPVQHHSDGDSRLSSRDMSSSSRGRDSSYSSSLSGRGMR